MISSRQFLPVNLIKVGNSRRQKCQTKAPIHFVFYQATDFFIWTGCRVKRYFMLKSFSIWMGWWRRKRPVIANNWELIMNASVWQKFHYNTNIRPGRHYSIIISDNFLKGKYLACLYLCRHFAHRNTGALTRTGDFSSYWKVCPRRRWEKKWIL